MQAKDDIKPTPTPITTKKTIFHWVAAEIIRGVYRGNTPSWSEGQAHLAAAEPPYIMITPPHRDHVSVS